MKKTNLEEVNSLFEAMELAIPTLQLQKEALADRLAYIISITLPGTPVDILQEAVKTMAEKPELLMSAKHKANANILSQSIIARAWSRISSNLPWNG